MRAAVLLVLALGIRGSAGAQSVRLELRPRAGDTLHMRLDQTTQITGGRRGSRAVQTVTTLTMFSRAIVENSAPASTLILAITDSVDLRTNDAHTRALAPEAERQLVGRRMRLRLAPDGVVAVARQQVDVPREVNDLVSVMPASFPRTAVAVGDTWQREMPIPPGAGVGVPFGGLVRATFTLDSVSRDSATAWVSMRGTVQDAEASAANPPTLSGTVKGTMTVDRRRGWLSESRFLVQMRATVTAGGQTGGPAQFRLRISQHMRVVER